MIAILLEESRDEMNTERGQSQTHINVSQGYTELSVLPVLQGKSVLQIAEKLKHILLSNNISRNDLHRSVMLTVRSCITTLCYLYVCMD